MARGAFEANVYQVCVDGGGGGGEFQHLLGCPAPTWQKEGSNIIKLSLVLPACSRCMASIPYQWSCSSSKGSPLDGDVQAFFWPSITTTRASDLMPMVSPRRAGRCPGSLRPWRESPTPLWRRRGQQQQQPTVRKCAHSWQAAAHPRKDRATSVPPGCCTLGAFWKHPGLPARLAAGCSGP